MNIKVAEKNLQDIKRILDEAGIRFWLAFGTFLGAYRDKAIIPYDGDIDLAVYLEDVPRLESCEGSFLNAGFGLIILPDKKGGSFQTSIYRNGERIGVAWFRPDNDKRVWKLLGYDTNDFETYNEIEFLGQKFRILSNPEKWLRYTYGDDWRVPISGKGQEGYPMGEL